MKVDVFGLFFLLWNKLSEKPLFGSIFWTSFELLRVKLYLKHKKEVVFGFKFLVYKLHRSRKIWSGGFWSISKYVLDSSELHLNDKKRMISASLSKNEVLAKTCSRPKWLLKETTYNFTCLNCFRLRVNCFRLPK